MALASSPDSPQPLGRVVMALRDWVGRTGEIWVDAQVIEIKRRSGPTQFLTFRDRLATVSATVTASAMVLDAAGPIPEGSRVTARLKARVWEKDTSLQFECLEIRVAGEGRLLAHLEQLKRKLQAEGLFDPVRRRPLPFLPRRIGLVTGRGSDAERDVLENTTRRWPAQFAVEHALVQGPDSAASVMAALAKLDADPEVDVIIVARGGGSLEDLLSFSDEGVVRAVAACHTPVVSAVGHEQDVPLIDFVADLRASTPTDAARHVVPDFREELDRLTEARARLRQAVETRLENSSQALAELRSRPVMQDPTRAFEPHFDRLELLRGKLTHAIDTRLRTEEATLATALNSVRVMSPRATLQRGYAVLVDAERDAVSSVSRVRGGDGLVAYLADGELELEVTRVVDKERDE